MPPLRLYLTATATWYMSMGLQTVLFSWLVAMVLFESPEKVGFAQMALLLPGLLLLLFGGSLGDRFGQARVAFVAQCCAALPPLALAVVLYREGLTYPVMILYAVIVGCIQAIVMPARDGLLNEVAGGRIQHTVKLATLAQFVFQIAGVTVAGLSDRLGGVVVLCIQAAVLFAGALSLRPLRGFDTPHTTPQPLLKGVVQGARTVLQSPAMRAVCIQNIAMGIAFMGSFIVSMPLLVREVFAGSATQLSLTNGMNALGMSLTIVVLLRSGDIQRQGRALLVAQLAGACVLVFAGLVPTFELFLVVAFFWGVCGGVAMTMSRTILQELAPVDQRSRTMAFYSLTFMGAGPIGALVSGYLAARFGPQQAVTFSALGMVFVVLSMIVFSSLWGLRTHLDHAESAT